MTATTGAVGQLTRLLALIPWLLQRPGVTAQEAAAEFGISEAQLRADLGLAFFCGLPGHMPDDLIDVSYDGDQIVVTNADTIARPLRFAPDEAVALIAGLRAMAEIPAPTRPDVLDRVIAKLERAAGDAADSHRQVTVAIEGSTPFDAEISQALREKRRLHLSYYVPARDQVTERDVDPMRLLVVDGLSYLEAWCLRAEGVRIFRLDRIEAVKLLDEPIEDHSDASLRDLSAGIFDTSGPGWTVVLQVSPRAEWIVDAYPINVRSREPSLVVDLRVADLAWARQLVMRLGGDVRPLEPPELAAMTSDEARQVLDAYGG
jgi:proteasome accessory factor C